VVLREKLIRPLLVASTRPEPRSKLPNPTPKDQHYENLRAGPGQRLFLPRRTSPPGGNMPRRRRERGSIPQPSILEGQPAHSQSGCPRRGKGQRKHLRNCVSRLVPRLGSAQAIGAIAHRFLPADLDCSAPWGLLRGTGARGQQKLKADTHCEDDPRTPTPRLSGRTAEFSAGQSSIARGTFNSDFRPCSTHQRKAPRVAGLLRSGWSEVRLSAYCE